MAAARRNSRNGGNPATRAKAHALAKQATASAKPKEQPPPEPTGEAPAPAPPPQGVDTEQGGMNHPAVLVVRVPTDQPGQENVQIVPLNGLDSLAVPTLLRVAIRVHEQQLGISERS